jgi:carboxypeptidase T
MACVRRIIILVTVVVSMVAAQDRYSKVRIPLLSGQTLRDLGRLGLAVDHVGGARGRWVDIIVSEREVALLTSRGVQFSVIADDWASAYARRLQADLQTEKAATSAVAHFHQGSMGGYLTLAEVVAELDSMHVLYPTLITVRDSIGETMEHRPLWAVKISKNAAVTENEPRAFYNALIHAREPEGMMQLLYFMWYLLERYGTDPEVTSILDTRELWFLPVINPDGYKYNEVQQPGGGGNWRKNRRHNADGSYGVDLNRNFGVGWGWDNSGSSPNPPDETYRGTAPFSEPEIQRVRDFCNSKGFAVTLNYHTYGNLLIYPWGYIDSETADSLIYRRMGEDMTAGNHYTYGTDGETVGYITNGSSDDWMYGDSLSKPKIFAMTPEVGSDNDGFWPLPSRILPIAEENLRPNLYLAHAAGEFVAVESFTVQDELSADSLVIQLYLINKGLGSSSGTVDLTVSSSTLQVLSPMPIHQSWASGVPVTIGVARPATYYRGRPASLALAIAYSGGYTVDTLTFLLGKPDTVFADNAETTRSRWIATGTFPRWDTTKVTAHSGRLSFADSPQGLYPDNASTTFLLDTTFHIIASSAQLTFWGRWMIEKGWDAVFLEASSDGGTTWAPLAGKYTSLASGLGAQMPAGVPLFDGSKPRWVQEVVDLHQYCLGSVRFRFRMASDGYVTYDGIYVDDILLLTYPLAPDAVERDTRPAEFALGQNFPNPFNPVTTIEYAVGGASGQGPRASEVRLIVYDVLGRDVATLVNEQKAPGRHEATFDASGLASGIYVYRLTAGSFVQSRKMLLLK